MSGRIALFGVMLVSGVTACADLWKFNDLQTGAGADATADSAAAGPVRDAGPAEGSSRLDFGDSNGDAGDEGETDAPVNPDCANTLCGDPAQCVDTQNDPRNCASCGTACATGASCVAGACSCPSAQPVSCDNVCVDTASDHGNCGGCGNACQAGYRCSVGACIPCEATDKMCSGVCADLLTDLSNCGSCGDHCPSGAVCQGGGCVCPTADPSVCPGPGDAGTLCVNSTSDHNNCGGCGNVCILAHATSSCTGSSCATSSCTSGFADCDKIAATGCEVDTGRDPNNCGGCGHVCTLPQATPSCSGASCGILSCSPGYMDCDLVASNGCEVNTARDPDNCGTCGSVCSLAHATAGCTTGGCTITSCNLGFADCDGIASNGCETDLAMPSSCGGCGVKCVGGTPICSASGCVSGCPSATPTLCSGKECIDTTSNVNDCGACGTVCTAPHATSGCASSICVIAGCAAGYADCDRLPADGCETHTVNDGNNCGSCGRVCSIPNANPTCSASSCVFTCQTGFADCDLVAANGCEINTTNDPNNCGGCGKTCTGGKVCQSSACVCAAGTHDCSGTCSSNTSPSSCGTATCTACPPPTNGQATCAGATPTCGMSCNGGSFPNLCGSACVNFTNDPGNCGSCGKACLTGGNCNASACVCPAGSSGCPLVGPTTCINTTGDPGNCGSCGNVCLPAGSTCTAGICTPPAVDAGAGSGDSGSE